LRRLTMPMGGTFADALTDLGSVPPGGCGRS
jgi:hypothetical protein